MNATWNLGVQIIIEIFASALELFGDWIHCIGCTNDNIDCTRKPSCSSYTHNVRAHWRLFLLLIT